MDQTVNTLGVIGSGQMGGGIAQIAAVAGIKVISYDNAQASLDRGRSTQEKLLNRAVEKGKMSSDDAASALSRISYTTDFDALAETDWVVEAVVEDTGVKKDIFKKLAKVCTRDEVVLATNTSSISITEIAAATGDAAHRVIGMHFFYPVPVMGLVEIIKGMQTDDAVVERTASLATRMGKTPLTANDRAGFVSNRVLMPMINEGFYAWMEGVAEPEAIDGIMKLGCNFPMGPLRLADFIGLDTCAHIMDVLAEGLNNDRYRPCPLLRQLVTAGRLGNKTGRGVFDYSNG